MPFPRIVVTEGLEKTPFDWLRANADVVEATWKNPRRPQGRAQGR